MKPTKREELLYLVGQALNGLSANPAHDNDSVEELAESAVEVAVEALSVVDAVLSEEASQHHLLPAS